MADVARLPVLEVSAAPILSPISRSASARSCTTISRRRERRSAHSIRSRWERRHERDVCARSSRASRPPIFRRSPANYDRVALVLQGGGALGAYQAGVYQALAEANCEPNWISGVSIGADQFGDHRRQSAGKAARGAGDVLEHRSPARKIWWHTPEGDFFRDLRNQTSAMMTIDVRPAGLFQAARRSARGSAAPARRDATSAITIPRCCGRRWRASSISTCSTTRQARFSVGAVNVRHRQFRLFQQSRKMRDPARSTSWLPARCRRRFPTVKIDGEYYWDGGHRFEHAAAISARPGSDGITRWCFRSICSARAASCRGGIADVMARQKDIVVFEPHAAEHRHLCARARIEDEAAATRAETHARRAADDESEKALIEEYSKSAEVNIVHLIYQQKEYEGDAKDYEFSRHVDARTLGVWLRGYVAHATSSRMAAALVDPARRRHP